MLTTKDPMSKTTTIKRALVSVSNKDGIVPFVQQLVSHGIEIISTGGTAKLLASHAIPVIEISDYTGFPEMMDGRVKTLHPKVHAGILARRGTDDATLAEQQIGTIDMVIVNLYPFAQVTAQSDCDFATAIENIDIGGPTMLRAAAKNHAYVSVIVDPNDYDKVLTEISVNHGNISDDTRLQLAKKTFAHTAHYDAMIANYLYGHASDGKFPDIYTVQYDKQQDLRYGENPHQQAAFYREKSATTGNISTAIQLQGKELSFNNIADSDAALSCVQAMPATHPACVIVKHANPCGVALGNDLQQAYQRAFATDSTSAFGGIIALNQTLDSKTAQTIIANQFVEVIIAPHIDDDAKAILATKKNVRVLQTGHWTVGAATDSLDYKKVVGGLLIQHNDSGFIADSDLRGVTTRHATEQELKDLLFAWRVAKYVKSNAIVYAKDEQTIGIGAGQMSRIDSAKIAGIKAQAAGLTVDGSVMASDAFFPFRDSIDTAATAGITAIIQPGGSIRDKEVIQAANEANIAMVFTGMRHFRH